LDDFAATGTALLYCCGGRFGRSRRSRSQSRTGDCRVIERGSIEKRCPSYADLKFELVFGDVDWIFAIRPGSEFDAEPCLRRPAIRRCACARADRGDRKRLCPHPRDRAVARRIPPRALRLPQRLGVGRVARSQLHRALPKLQDRVSEPPLDKLMTLQGVYEKWLGTLPPTLGERHGGRASGNGRAQSIGARERGPVARFRG
jgi:hypothetical protein